MFGRHDMRVASLSDKLAAPATASNDPTTFDLTSPPRSRAPLAPGISAADEGPTCIADALDGQIPAESHSTEPQKCMPLRPIAIRPYPSCSLAARTKPLAGARSRPHPSEVDSDRAARPWRAPSAAPAADSSGPHAWLSARRMSFRWSRASDECSDGDQPPRDVPWGHPSPAARAAPDSGLAAPFAASRGAGGGKDIAHTLDAHARADVADQGAAARPSGPRRDSLPPADAGDTRPCFIVGAGEGLGLHAAGGADGEGGRSGDRAGELRRREAPPETVSRPGRVPPEPCDDPVGRGLKRRRDSEDGLGHAQEAAAPGASARRQRLDMESDLGPGQPGRGR